MAMNGTDILVLIDGHVVGSQRDASFTRNTAEIDVSNKESADQRVLPGRKKSAVTLEALYVPDDSAYLALLAAWNSGTFVEVMRQEGGGVLESAQAIVTELSEKAPDQDAVTVTCSLTIDGAWSAGS